LKTNQNLNDSGSLFESISTNKHNSALLIAIFILLLGIMAGEIAEDIGRDNGKEARQNIIVNQSEQ